MKKFLLLIVGILTLSNAAVLYAAEVEASRLDGLEKIKNTQAQMNKMNSDFKSLAKVPAPINVGDYSDLNGLSTLPKIPRSPKVLPKALILSQKLNDTRSLNVKASPQAVNQSGLSTELIRSANTSAKNPLLKNGQYPEIKSMPAKVTAVSTDTKPAQQDWFAQVFKPKAKKS